MCHANVIVLITPQYPGESNHANLWKQPYALPNGKVGRSAREAVRKMLAPYGYSTRERGAWPAGVVHCIGWDGYWIGGSWGGQFDPQYDVMKDPRNQQRCTGCMGTGWTFVFGKPAASQSGSKKVCGLCHGTGRCAKSADERTPVDGDIAPVAMLPEKLDAYAVITPDGIWHECGEWFGEVLHEPGVEGWEAKIKRLLEQHRDAVAVNVDIHF